MRFSTELLPLLADQPGVMVEVSGEPADYREAGDTLRITVSTDEVAGDTDWFDLGVTITVAGRPVPFLDVFLALSRGEPHLLLPDGAWFSLDKPELRALARLISEARALQDAPGGPVKIAITGTPLENNLMELWSLLSITAPGLFPGPDRFREYYAKPVERQGDTERLAQLRRRIRPLVLRRTKEQVAADLPPKQEQILEVEGTRADR
jgi:hypothetical protein